MDEENAAAFFDLHAVSLREHNIEHLARVAASDCYCLPGLKRVFDIELLSQFSFATTCQVDALADNDCN